jgi:hypothetical protein
MANRCWAGPIGLAAAALLLLPAPQSCLSAQETRYQSPQPTHAELTPVAALLVQSSPQIAQIWPGFWSDDESFLLLSPTGGMLLVASFAPPPEFTPAQAAVGNLGRAFTRDGGLPGFQPGSFPGLYDIAGHSTYALPPMGTTLFRRVAYYTHEAFHFHQRQGATPWASTPGDSIMGLSPVAFLRDSGIVRDPEFRAGLRREDELLRRMLAEQDRTTLRNLSQQYLAARGDRHRGRPDVVGIEQRYERREGTAVYVGCRAAGIALRDSAAVNACVVRDLGDENPANPALQFLRWRPYSVGAILALVLDRLEVPSWKSAVAAGEQLDQLVAREVARAP